MLCKNRHSYSILAQSQILLYVHQQFMVPDHGTQTEKNPLSHHVVIHQDVLTNEVTDGWTAGLTARRMD